MMVSEVFIAIWSEGLNVVEILVEFYIFELIFEVLLRVNVW